MGRPQELEATPCAGLCGFAVVYQVEHTFVAIPDRTAIMSSMAAGLAFPLPATNRPILVALDGHGRCVFNSGAYFR
jgi:hypothetical protein